MADRYDDNRERFEGGRRQPAERRGEFEGGYQNRGYAPGGERAYGPGSEGRNRGYEGGYSNYQGRNMGSEFQSEEGSRGGENRYGYDQNYQTNEGRYGNQRQFNEGYGNRGYSQQGGRRSFPGDAQRGMETDDYLYPDSMATTYPRRNEWSSGSGISSGLGGAENSEYTTDYRRSGYYGGQGQFGGGLNQYSEQGRYAGRGPKGYKRSDERIKEDVNERLTQDPHVDAGEIEVEVKEGEVTLTGTIDSRQGKRRAEDLIENISGVREIHNQLRVQSGRDTQAAPATSSSGKQGSQGKELSSSGQHSSKS